MGLRDIRLRIKELLRVENELIRKFFAEFIGTFILIAFGCGVNAQSTLSRSQAGTFLSVNLGWGWGVAMGVWASGGVSGGHLNPAVSLAMAVLGRLKLIQMPIYWCAQYLGAFAASACVYGVYYEALNHYDNGTRYVTGPLATAGIFGTYPQDYLTNAAGFGDQVFGTMLLVLCIMALTDRFNSAPTSGLTPLGVAGAIMAIGMSYGYNCGYAINPARDFSPRAFTAAAGWGVEVFTIHEYWFYVPLVAPHIGAVAGAWFYQLLVGIHSERTDDQLESIDNKNQQNSVPSQVVATEINGL